MANIDTGELAAKAVIKEAGLSASPTDEAAKSLRTTLTQQGAEATLQVAAGRAVDPGQVDYVINENIGTERGADGKKIITPGSEEDKRLDKATKQKDILTIYLDKGYDGLNNLQKGEARLSILNLANSIPAFAPVLAGMSTGQQTQFAERILKDPRYVKLVKEGLAGSIDLVKVKPDTVSQLQLEFDNLSKELASITTELGAVDKRIKEIEEALVEHQVEVEDPPKSGKMRPGKNYDRINKARGEIGTKSSSIIGDEQDLDVKNSELEYFQNELLWATGKEKPPSTWSSRTVSDVKKDISTKSGEIDGINKKILPIKLEIKQREDLIKQLEKEQEDFRQEKAQREARKKELDEKKLEKEKEVKGKEASLGKAKADRTQYEEQFVRGLESILTNAAEQYIQERINDATSESKTMLENQAKEEKDGRETIISAAEVKRYFDGTRIKADQARTDYQEVINNGPDKIIDELLATKYTDPAKRAEIMKDTAFMDKMRKQVATDVVKYYLLRGGWLDRGGKVHTDEIIKLGSSPWGVKVIEDAMTGKKQIQDQIKSALPNLPERSKWGEWIRGLDFRKLMIVLLIIMGILGVGGLVVARH